MGIKEDSGNPLTKRVKKAFSSKSRTRNEGQSNSTPRNKLKGEQPCRTDEKKDFKGGDYWPPCTHPLPLSTLERKSGKSEISKIGTQNYQSILTKKKPISKLEETSKMGKNAGQKETEISRIPVISTDKTKPQAASIINTSFSHKSNKSNNAPGTANKFLRNSFKLTDKTKEKNRENKNKRLNLLSSTTIANTPLLRSEPPDIVQVNKVSPQADKDKYLKSVDATDRNQGSHSETSSKAVLTEMQDIHNNKLPDENMMQITWEGIVAEEHDGSAKLESAVEPTGSVLSHFGEKSLMGQRNDTSNIMGEHVSRPYLAQSSRYGGTNSSGLSTVKVGDGLSCTNITSCKDDSVNSLYTRPENNFINRRVYTSEGVVVDNSSRGANLRRPDDYRSKYNVVPEDQQHESFINNGCFDRFDAAMTYEYQAYHCERNDVIVLALGISQYIEEIFKALDIHSRGFIPFNQVSLFFKVIGKVNPIASKKNFGCSDKSNIRYNECKDEDCYVHIHFDLFSFILRDAFRTETSNLLEQRNNPKLVDAVINVKRRTKTLNSIAKALEKLENDCIYRNNQYPQFRSQPDSWYRSMRAQGNWDDVMNKNYVQNMELRRQLFLQQQEVNCLREVIEDLRMALQCSDAENLGLKVEKERYNSIFAPGGEGRPTSILDEDMLSKACTASLTDDEDNLDMLLKRYACEDGANPQTDSGLGLSDVSLCGLESLSADSTLDRKPPDKTYRCQDADQEDLHFQLQQTYDSLSDTKRELEETRNDLESTVTEIQEKSKALETIKKQLENLGEEFAAELLKNKQLEEKVDELDTVKKELEAENEDMKQKLVKVEEIQKTLCEMTEIKRELQLLKLELEKMEELKQSMEELNKSEIREMRKSAPSLHENFESFNKHSAVYERVQKLKRSVEELRDFEIELGESTRDSISVDANISKEAEVVNAMYCIDCGTKKVFSTKGDETAAHKIRKELEEMCLIKEEVEKIKFELEKMEEIRLENENNSAKLEKFQADLSEYQLKLDFKNEECQNLEEEIKQLKKSRESDLNNFNHVRDLIFKSLVEAKKGEVALKSIREYTHHPSIQTQSDEVEKSDCSYPASPIKSNKRQALVCLERDKTPDDEESNIRYGYRHDSSRQGFPIEAQLNENRNPETRRKHGSLQSHELLRPGTADRTSNCTERREKHEYSASDKTLPSRSYAELNETKSAGSEGNRGYQLKDIGVLTSNGKARDAIELKSYGVSRCDGTNGEAQLGELSRSPSSYSAGKVATYLEKRKELQSSHMEPGERPDLQKQDLEAELFNDLSNFSACIEELTRLQGDNTTAVEESNAVPKYTSRGNDFNCGTSIDQLLVKNNQVLLEEDSRLQSPSFNTFGLERKCLDTATDKIESLQLKLKGGINSFNRNGAMLESIPLVTKNSTMPNVLLKSKPPVPKRTTSRVYFDKANVERSNSWPRRNGPFSKSLRKQWTKREGEPRNRPVSINVCEEIEPKNCFDDKASYSSLSTTRNFNCRNRDQVGNFNKKLQLQASKLPDASQSSISPIQDTQLSVNPFSKSCDDKISKPVKYSVNSMKSLDPLTYENRISSLLETSKSLCYDNANRASDKFSDCRPKRTVARPPRYKKELLETMNSLRLTGEPSQSILTFHNGSASTKYPFENDNKNYSSKDAHSYSMIDDKLNYNSGLEQVTSCDSHSSTEILEGIEAQLEELKRSLDGDPLW